MLPAPPRGDFTAGDADVKGSVNRCGTSADPRKLGAPTILTELLRGEATSVFEDRRPMSPSWIETLLRGGRRSYVFASGVTAGIDAALTAAAGLRGSDEAQAIQLSIEYAPDPPFHSGTPATAPSHVLDRVRDRGLELLDRRRATARRLTTDWV